MKHLYTEISAKLPLHPLRRFFRMVAGERRTVIQIYIYAILAGIIGLSLPLGVQAIINQVAAGTMTTSWYVLIGIVILGVLVGGVIQILQLALSEAIQQRIFVKSSLELAYRIPRLEPRVLRRHYVPELVNRFFDTVTVQKGFSKILLDFSAASLQIFFGLILLSFYHPMFIFFGIALLVILLLIIRVTGPMGLRTSLQESKHKYEVAHWLEEIGRNRDLFKGPFQDKHSMRKTDDLTMNYLGARKNHFRILVSKYAVLLVFRLLIIAGLLVIGSMLVVENQLNIGQFVAAEIVIILIISSIEKLVLSIETIYDVLTGLEKIGYITDMPLEDPGTDSTPDPLRGSGIVFDNYTLAFPDDPSEGLHGVKLNIPPGTRILVYGSDGRSRQAFMRSIAGDFRYYSGDLSVGGIPVRNWNKRQLRQLVGLFNGPTDIFDGNILENLQLLSGPVPFSKIASVAEALDFSSEIANLPESWDKETGPDGIWLSERLRPALSLGRLLLGEPRIIVLNRFFSTVPEPLRKRFLAWYDRLPHPPTMIFLEDDPAAEEFCHQAYCLPTISAPDRELQTS